MATTLNVIKTFTIRASVEGMPEAERKIQEFLGGLEGVTVATEKQTKAFLSNEAAIAKLQSRYDQEFRAQQQIADAQKKVNQALDQGLISQQRASEIMQQAITFHNKSSAAIAQTSKTTDQFASSTKASRFELLNLSRQLQDVGVGIASGQRGFTVLIQQGSQIFDAFQSASLSGRSLTSSILGLITPLRVLTVGTLAAAAAGVLLFQSWKSVEMQFLNLSERLNVPIDKLHELEAAAAIKGINLDEFVKGMEAFGDQVNLAKRDLGDLGEIFRLNGIRSKDTLTDFARFADLVKNARIEDRFKLAATVGLGSPEWVRLLSQGGEAIRKIGEEMTAAGTGADEDMIKKAREFDEAWNKAWKSFSLGWRTAFVEILEGMGKLIDEAGIFEKLLPKAGGQQGFATAADEQRLMELGQRRAREMGLLGPAPGAAGGGGPLRVTVTPADLQAQERQLSLERERISLLGNLATEEEKVKLKVDEVNLARTKGVQISDAEAQKIREVAEAQERANRSARTVAALGEAATTMEKYKAAVDAATVALKDGTLTQDQFNRKLLEINPAVKAVSDAVAQLGGDMATAFLNGANAADALNASLKSIASTAASEAIRNLTHGDFAGAGISAAIAGVAAIGSVIFGGSDAKAQQEAAQAQLQAAQAAGQAAEAVSQAAEALKKLGDSVKGPFQTQLENAERAFDDLKDKVNEGHTALMTYAAAVGFGTPAALEAGKAYQDLDRRLQEGADNLKAFTGQLQVDFFDEIARQTREAQGIGFLNQFSDMLNGIAQLRSDANALGVDATQQIDDLLKLQSQKLVNDLELTTDQFQLLLQTFPELTGVVTEFNAAAEVTKRSVDELAKSAQSLQQRLFNATNDPSTLAGALAAFDFSANQQIQDEAKAGGENMVLLEQTLAAERLRIIQDFNDKAVEAEKQAADDRMDAINSAAKNIVDYINGLMTGASGGLSPANRLAAARSAFQSQLALAQGGNLEAQQGITKFAEDFRQAAKDMFGSSQQFQDIQNQIVQQLGALPAVQQANDPVVMALGQVVGAVNGTTDAIGDTTTAVNTTTAEVAAQSDLLTTANIVQNATNDLIATSNQLSDITNTFLQSINGLLAAIQTQTAVLISSEDHLNNIQNGINNVIARTSEISSHTSHMYAPGGSLNFFLAKGGMVPDYSPFGSNVVPLRRAYGGPVGTDTVPAMLTPGEFIVSRSAAQAHAANLSALNSTGRWPSSDITQSEIRTLGIMLSGLLQQLVQLQAEGNQEIAANTQATHSQTMSLNREQRFASRKGAA